MKSLLRLLAAGRALWWPLLSLAPLWWAPNVAWAKDTCPAPPPPLTAEQREALQPAAQDRGFLWRITKDGRTSWLYGTMHLGEAAWSVLGPKVTHALGSSQVLAVEFDVTDPGMQWRMTTAMAYRPERALPAPLHERMLKHLRAACQPELLAKAIDPEMVAVTLVAGASQTAGLDAAHGSEMVLVEAAKAAGQRVVSLETPEQQLKLLLSPTRKEMLASVEQMLGELEKNAVAGPMKALAAAWARGDEKALLALDRTGRARLTPGQRGRMQALLDGRNPGMADGIDALHMKGEQVFAAVGALHLLGPGSVPELMARRGYRVERIPLAR